MQVRPLRPLQQHLLQVQQLLTICMLRSLRHAIIHLQASIETQAVRSLQPCTAEMTLDSGWQRPCSVTANPAFVMIIIWCRSDTRAAAGPDPGMATDVPDSRTESSAGRFDTVGFSLTPCRGLCRRQRHQRLGGRNQRHTGSTPAGLHGPADLQRPRQLFVKGVPVSSIPEAEGEQLPTGVPEQLPPPAPPLGLHDRQESGNLADAEDEPPGEQAAAAPLAFNDVPRIQEGGDVAAAELKVHHEASVLPSGMFAGLELA